MTNGSHVRSYSLRMEGEAIKVSIVHESTAETRHESMSASRMVNGDGEEAVPFSDVYIVLFTFLAHF